jgi:methionyl-tRNA formyltransferase
VNFHPSLLPLYRGPVPSYWCIINEEQATGYTLHEVTTKIDCGKVLFQEVVRIEAGIDEASLDQEIAKNACLTLKRYLDNLYLRTPFEPRTVDAYEVYRNHVSYASFPER